MDKRKIETFGEFCELIATEPENVYGLTGTSNCTIRNIDDLLTFFENTCYHIPPKKKVIPPKKKVTKCQWYGNGNGQMYVLNDTDDGLRHAFIKIEGTEFEVDE